MATQEMMHKDVATLKILIDQLKGENATLAQRNQELVNLVDMKESKIDQMEKLVDCYSSELESIPSIHNVIKQLESTIKVCDELRIDNFHLKTKLADE